MKPFTEASYNPMEIQLLTEDVMNRFKLTKEQAEVQVKESIMGRVYKNDTYQVLIRDAEVSQGFPEMLWLSIKRLDREPIRDWRDLQKIKNILVGEENEGVELYPAESRLLDLANQFHIWVLKNPQIKFPFGFNDGRNVSDSTLGKSKQRKL